MAKRTFDKFIQFADLCYMTLGMRSYKRATEGPKSLPMQFTFLVMWINLYVTYIFQIMYVFVLPPGVGFLGATLALSYLGFVTITVFKLAHVQVYMQYYTDLMNSLDDIYPKDVAGELIYNVPYYLRKCTRITFIFSTLYMVTIWTFNLFMIIPFLIFDRWLGIREIEMELPYLIYIPWVWQNHWSYYPLYVSQVLAGYASAAGQISSDLVLVGAATQLIMHYDFIARSLREHRPEGKESDMQFLSDIIKYHTRILHLSKQMNSLFGVPLLFNFLISSWVICFVGFLMTVGIEPEIVSKLALFLTISTAEVFVICYYGQELQTASANIAEAAYAQMWYDGDVRYKKMLVLITVRAQKPASLNATTFITISRTTMTLLLQISYKYFAVLRTIYMK